MIDLQTRTPGAATGGQATFTVGYDPVRNLITIRGHGFLEAHHFDEMFVQTGKLFGARHAAGQPVRMMVDNRRIMLHAPGTIERLRQRALLHPPDTRIAIIVESSLARMQFRRVLDMSIHAFFTTEEEAIAWLLEGDQG